MERGLVRSVTVGEEKSEEGFKPVVDDFDRPGAAAAPAGEENGSENWRYVDERDMPKMKAWEDLLMAKRKQWSGKDDDGGDDGDDRQESQLSEADLRHVREIWETDT